MSTTSLVERMLKAASFTIVNTGNSSNAVYRVNGNTDRAVLLPWHIS